MEAQKGDHKFLLYYSDQVTHAMMLGNGSKTHPKASLLAPTLKLTVTLTLVVNRLLVSFVADPGFFVGFLLTLI